jgi:flagellar hook-basal body complex protein FliE
MARIDGASILARIASRPGQAGAAQAGGGGGPSFAETLDKALGEVTDTQANAEDVIAAFTRGEPVEIHEVMAAAEEAGIALEMLVEVRNQFVDAYRTLINMQA